MYKGYIYRHWHINEDDAEKSYIGQVYNKTPQRRWRNNGKGYTNTRKKDGSLTDFAKAIIKYGWDNFNHEVLFSIECETLEELVFWLDEWEKYYIEKYDSFRNGYNGTTGGSNGKIVRDETKQKQSDSMKKWYENGGVNPNYGKTLEQEVKDEISKTLKDKYANGEIINPRLGVPCEEETRQKISEANTGKKRTEETKQHLSEIFSGEGNPMYGKTFTQEHRQHISEGLTGRMLTDEHRTKISERTKGENNPMYGVHRYGEDSPHYGHKHSEETRQQLREKAIERDINGSSNPNAKKVICLNTLEVFDSGIDAQNWCNTSNKAICKCCRGGSNTSGKHPITGEKLRWMFYKDYLEQKEVTQ